MTTVRQPTNTYTTQWDFPEQLVAVLDMVVHEHVCILNWERLPTTLMIPRLGPKGTAVPNQYMNTH